MNSNYNEETVRAFKSYIMQVIQHSSVDYIRKVKSSKYTEIAFTDAIDNTVSLSSFDEGTFFDFDSVSEITFSNNKRKKAFSKLTKNERNILIYTAEGLSDKEIAFELGLKTKSIKVIRNKARNKFKDNMEE